MDQDWRRVHRVQTTSEETRQTSRATYAPQRSRVLPVTHAPTSPPSGQLVRTYAPSDIVSPGPANGTTYAYPSPDRAAPVHFAAGAPYNYYYGQGVSQYPHTPGPGSLVGAANSTVQTSAWTQSDPYHTPSDSLPGQSTAQSDTQSMRTGGRSYADVAQLPSLPGTPYSLRLPPALPDSSSFAIYDESIPGFSTQLSPHRNIGPSPGPYLDMRGSLPFGMLSGTNVTSGTLPIDAPPWAPGQLNGSPQPPPQTPPQTRRGRPSTAGSSTGTPRRPKSEITSTASEHTCSVCGAGFPNSAGKA
ncbi:hypothetical protein BAUCODRAFT_26538 [Baudoinia panamericana UAMH 10762]|uniref:Uncharacterized protein n=1 Tax=Baudoinia panamericana (strain UAMH 10762) TaxID=717646 RepID=M2N3B9_BAUPA|nr:uncharacterized protein BAUCODRAFT_26538 [Baudoinia panamericana UAMH 10762]EMC93210.1 hypothetical protein BAUCODRAFT_26538 [Baudoinia panamericana UAMH 10762]